MKLAISIAALGLLLAHLALAQQATFDPPYYSAQDLGLSAKDVKGLLPGQMYEVPQSYGTLVVTYVGRVDGQAYFSFTMPNISVGCPSNMPDCTKARRQVGQEPIRQYQPADGIDNEETEPRPIDKSGQGNGPSTDPNSAKGNVGGGISAGKIAGDVGKAVGMGIAQSLFKGLVWTPRDQRDLEVALDQINRTRAKNEKIRGKLDVIGREASDTFSGAFHAMNDTLRQMSADGGIPIPQDEYQVITQAPELRQKVVEARRVLKSIYVTEQHRLELRDAGLRLTEEADQAYSHGDVETGDQALHYGWIIADVLVGWDPVTGIGRGLYEIATGRNMFTGEELSNADLAKAGIAVVLAGIGAGAPQKAAKALRVLSKVAKDRKIFAGAANGVRKFYDYFKGSQGIVGAAGDVENLAAHSSFRHSRYVRELMRVSEKPWVGDAKLNSLLDDLYRVNPEALGNGSTAVAIMNERVTGLPTRGKYHIEKGRKYVEALQNWLRRNPGASTHDRHTAERVMQSLLDALEAPLGELGRFGSLALANERLAA